MEKLTEQLDVLINHLADSNDFRKELEGLHSIYPFNKFEYIIATLFSNGKITFDEYLEIRDDYIKSDIYEGQIMMTEKNIHDFDKFLVVGKNLKKTIIKAYEKK